jgi:hypothetical protein
MPHADLAVRKQYHADYMRTYLADPVKRAARNAVANVRIRKVKDWINAYKLDHGCIDCGYRRHPAALDFDHTDGKTANISSLKSIEAVQREIDRHSCVVRCSNCHRIKSWAASNDVPYEEVSS